MAQQSGDLLFRLSQGPARSLLRSMGLPTPVALSRGSGRFYEPPLTGQTVTVLSSGPRREVLSTLMTRKLGASVSGGGGHGGGGPLRLLLDCTGVKIPSDVTSLVTGTLQLALSKVPPNSRIVLLSGEESTPAAGAGGSSSPSRSPMNAALVGGLYSLARSLAKELGAMGTTVNVVRVTSPLGGDGALLGHAAWPLAFFLLPDSAFVSGQEVCVGTPLWTRPPAEERQAGGQRVALVTGASRGIGAAISTRLAAEGLKVIGVDVPALQEPLHQLMGSLGGLAVCEDVTTTEAPQRLSNLVMGEGGVDVLVHNAGITKDKTLRKMRPEQFEHVMRVNLEAIVSINEALGLVDGHEGQGGGMGVKPGGRVILQSSINGIAGAMGQTNYSFTKGALISYARELATAHSLARHGITINCTAPGFIETDMVRKMPPMLQFLGRRANALSQGGTPEDVAAAVAFLSAEAAGGVTGQVLRVCGLNAVGR